MPQGFRGISGEHHAFGNPARTHNNYRYRVFVADACCVDHRFDYLLNWFNKIKTAGFHVGCGIYALHGSIVKRKMTLLGWGVKIPAKCARGKKKVISYLISVPCYWLFTIF